MDRSLLYLCNAQFLIVLVCLTDLKFEWCYLGSRQNRELGSRLFRKEKVTRSGTKFGTNSLNKRSRLSLTNTYD